MIKDEQKADLSSRGELRRQLGGANRLAPLTCLNGGVATYVRDAAGRIKSITYRHTPTTPVQTIVSNVSYLPFGPLTQLTFGNGRTLTKTYDQNYAIDAISSAPGDGLNLDYTVDVVGNIVSITGEATRTRATAAESSTTVER